MKVQYSIRNIMFTFCFKKDWKYKVYRSVVQKGYPFKPNDDNVQLSQERFCSR